MSLKNLELWFLKFLSFLAGCWFCFFLQSHFSIGAVIAAAVTGLLGTFIPDTKRIDSTHVHANIYMGAFVAMGSQVVDAGGWQILLVSVIGSTLYFALNPYFKGLGGKLGFVAFVSSILSLMMRHWL